MLPWGAPGTGCPRTLLPGEPQPLPVAHRGWHRTSHAACTEHYSRHAWHWCPLVFFSLKAPFSVVTWVLGERLFTCCQGGREARLQSSAAAAPALPCPPPAGAYVRACARPPLSTPLDVVPPRPAHPRLRRSGRGGDPELKGGRAEPPLREGRSGAPATLASRAQRLAGACPALPRPWH